jgi:hypothetical protein
MDRNLLFAIEGDIRNLIRTTDEMIAELHRINKLGINSIIRDIRYFQNMIFTFQRELQIFKGLSQVELFKNIQFQSVSNLSNRVQNSRSKLPEFYERIEGIRHFIPYDQRPPARIPDQKQG